MNKSATRATCMLVILLLMCSESALVVAPQSTVQFSAQSPAQILKEATYYHGIDDTTDRAADRYRQLLSKFPYSSQAEQAQFFLGTYYEKKFFILESRNKVQDWTSFNQAEDALNGYIKKYGSGKGPRTYLADAFFNLAIISLRRGYPDRAKQFLQQMKSAAGNDRTVYIYKVVWSSRTDDILKSDCDTNNLAAGALDIIGAGLNFGSVISRLNDWCRRNCKTSADSSSHRSNHAQRSSFKAAAHGTGK